MGFDVNRFDGPVSPDLVCPICRDVFEDPVQRPSCEHYFCRKCIASRIKDTPTCPIDKRRLKESDLKDAPRLLSSLLANLNIRCDFSGCPMFVKLDQLVVHIKDCAFNPDAVLTCSMGCGAEMRRRSLSGHSCCNHLLEVVKKLEISRSLLEEERNEGAKREEWAKHEKDCLVNQMEKERLNSEAVIVGLKSKVEEMMDEREALRRDHQLTDEVNERKKETNVKEKKVLRRENKILHKIVAKQGGNSMDGEKKPKAGLACQATVGHKPKSPPLPMSSTSAEHRDLINQLKEKGFITDGRVFNTMLAVDFCTLFDNNPYDKRMAEEIAVHLDLWSPYVKSGSKVLHVMRHWDDMESLAPYEWVALANWVQPAGHVLGVSATRYNQLIARSHGKLFESQSLRLLLVPDCQSVELEPETYDFLVIYYFAEATTFLDSIKLGGTVTCGSSRQMFRKNSNGALEKVASNMSFA